ncbi:organomercurial lyase [Candidatus Entotheonella palauensis]|uniref:Alkylmercury lyase n=1 Tax=Candidatus Entotheonella gemina TaxID=1429439 RepID=W4LQT8_9BACT|nr:organomercurial lyase [Candidatus Entotheonella palauensis]ETX00318.1 MAG: hypothetical protein ETSY2_39310 [Candidatus Entotheonella gemina]
MISKAELKQAWQQRHRHLSELQEQLRRAAFDLVRAGCAATDVQLAERVKLPLDRVRDELSTLEQQGLVVWDVNGVVGIYGLSLVATPHRLNLDGRALFTWCALDAVGIAAGLVSNAMIQASCFHCGAALTIRFRAGRVCAVSTADVRLWLTPPGQGASAVADT